MPLTARAQSSPGRQLAGLILDGKLDAGWGLFCYRFTLKPDQRVWQRLGRCAPLTALLLSALCSMTYAPGVEVFTDFADRGEVRHRSTPSGDTTATAHYGEYSDLAAYAALEQWYRDNGRRAAGEARNLRSLGPRSRGNQLGTSGVIAAGEFMGVGIA